jgi:hypothetical protein
MGFVHLWKKCDKRKLRMFERSEPGGLGASLQEYSTIYRIYLPSLEETYLDLYLFANKSELQIKKTPADEGL